MRKIHYSNFCFMMTVTICGCLVNCVYIFAAYVIYGDFNMFRALSQQPYYLHATELPRGINVMGDFVSVRKNGDEKI